MSSVARISRRLLFSLRVLGNRSSIEWRYGASLYIVAPCPERGVGSGMMDDFETAEVETGETRIFVRWSGSGSPILLLHGFPQTHLMWRSVAPLLARNFTVVCADLRGYGRSGCPVSTPDHAPYAKRAMAQDMVIVMERLGFRPSRSRGTIVAVASPIAWLSTIPAVLTGSPSSTSCRRRRRGIFSLGGIFSRGACGLCP